MVKVQIDSESGDDFDIDKTFTKGPWSTAEDELLIAYVKEHGDGNWNAVQKNSGLSRCGKSCRLRWVNHLRPDLKKGAFTEKEEQRVIELHALMGNKWARMAAELPGRTDNEIKNFWNTRIKRLQRQGLPIYPDEIREQAMNAANLSGQNTDSLDPHLTQESLEPYNIELPELEGTFLQLRHCSSTYLSMLRSTAMRPRPSYYQPTTYNSNNNNLIPSQSDQLWNYPSSVDNISQQFNVLGEPDSQFLGDATYSSPSEPLFNEAEDLELHSIQSYDLQEEPDDWLIQQSSPMPALESDNSLVQSPIMPPLHSPSKFCDGLLESVVYGSSAATNTDSDCQMFHPFLLGDDTGLPPAVHNLNFDGSVSSDEQRPCFDPDFIRRLLGEDRGETK